MDVSLDVDILKMYFCRKNQAFSEGCGYFTFNAIYADIAHFIQELRSLNEYFKCPITTHATDMGEPMKTINGKSSVFLVSNVFMPLSADSQSCKEKNHIL